MRCKSVASGRVNARHAGPNLAREPATARGRSGVRDRIAAVLLPELRAIAPAERDAALRSARDTPLDLLELIGMAAGLIVVTALTQHVFAQLALASSIASGIANFVVALPLLVLALGPFHRRRLRRGLRAQATRRNAP